MMTVQRYDSIDAFVTAAAKGKTLDEYNGSHDREWDLGVNGREAIRRATFGDPTIAAKVGEGMADVAINVAPELVRIWETAVSGSRVNMSAYLAGSPMHMRRRRASEVAATNVAIYVDGSCFVGCKADDMLRRGVAILGLLESLQTMGIGTELYLYMLHRTSSGSGAQIIRCESRPLDLSTTGFALAHPAFFRNVVYGHVWGMGSQGRWPSQYVELGGSRHDPRYLAWVRETIGASERDIVLPQVNGVREIPAKPAAWITQRIEALAA